MEKAADLERQLIRNAAEELEMISMDLSHEKEEIKRFSTQLSNEKTKSLACLNKIYEEISQLIKARKKEMEDHLEKLFEKEKKKF